MAKRDPHPTSTGTVAILGGAGVLAWLLLRRGGAGEGSGAGASASATTPSIVPGSRCVIWILPGDRLEADGVAAELPTVVARCRTVEYVEVHARGDARQGFVTGTVQALYAAGIKLHVAHDLATIVPAQVLAARNAGPPVVAVHARASSAPQVASELAHEVGGTVAPLGRAQLRGLGMPVLVSGGALVALYLLAGNYRMERAT